MVATLTSTLLWTERYVSSFSDNQTSFLRQEFEARHKLFQAQPISIQEYLTQQAHQLALALIVSKFWTVVILPERLLVPGTESNPEQSVVAPSHNRRRLLINWSGTFNHQKLATVIQHNLAEWEKSPDLAISTGVMLVRHALVLHLVYHLLPDCLAENASPSAFSASLAASPQAQEDLQENQQTERDLVTLGNYFNALEIAEYLAPYIVANEFFQQKRYEVLDRLMNQGHSLALRETEEMINLIWQRAEADDLNHGLSLSLPYFDSQDLRLKTWDFVVIPDARIPFLPAYVAYAARKELIKVAQDQRLNQSTQLHLISELRKLENAFLPKPAGEIPE